MSGIRDRLERERIDALYREQEQKSQATPQQIAEREEAARRERLAANAKKIRESKMATMLIDMNDAERECVFSLVGRTRPDALGSDDVISATLLRVRTEGAENLRVALEDATPEEQRQFGERLQHESAEALCGMDGGARAREILRAVRSENYLEGK
jgi:hypothetical protein